MQIDRFRNEFKKLNGVYATEQVVLFRKPLELYDVSTGEVLASFNSLEEALAYRLGDKTLEECVQSWKNIEFTRDGGRGGDSGLGTFKFGHAPRDRGSRNDKPDLPARLNVKTHISEKSPEAALKAFREAHALDNYESGVTVDEQGFVTRYVHGAATSVGIWGGKGEMVYHNHPSGRAFSDSDLLSTAMSAEKGIVASGKYGDYVFTKTHKFNANAFAKAVKGASMQGKDYNDAVDKWLTKNQKKYGYKYSFNKV